MIAHVSDHDFAKIAIVDKTSLYRPMQHFVNGDGEYHPGSDTSMHDIIIPTNAINGNNALICRKCGIEVVMYDKKTSFQKKAADINKLLKHEKKCKF